MGEKFTLKTFKDVTLKDIKSDVTVEAVSLKFLGTCCMEDEFIPLDLCSYLLLLGELVQIIQKWNRKISEIQYF